MHLLDHRSLVCVWGGGGGVRERETHLGNAILGSWNVVYKLAWRELLVWKREALIFLFEKERGEDIKPAQLR